MKRLFFIAALLPMLLFGQAFSPSDIAFTKKAVATGSTLNSGLVSYWKLDETSGTRDDASGANDLTDNNTVTSATGIIGNAAFCQSGNSEFLSIADNASFGFTTAFSFSCWVYRGSLAILQTIAGKWTYQTDGGWILQSGSVFSGDLVIGIATSATDTGAGCFMDFADANQSADVWYNLVLIYDGSLTGDANRLKLYQNGVLLTLTPSFGAVPASLQADTADFNLGKFGGSLTRYWSGYIDETGLWNRALTSGEVTELYNAGAGKTCCPFAAP